MLMATGAVAELATTRETGAGQRPWRERISGCVQCGYQNELGTCRYCGAWICSWHRTMSHQPQQVKRLGGVDCQCYPDLEACRRRASIDSELYIPTLEQAGGAYRSRVPASPRQMIPIPPPPAREP